MAKRKGPVLTIPKVHMQPVDTKPLGIWNAKTETVLVPECSHWCPFLNMADGCQCRLGWQKDGAPGPKCVPGKYRLVKV